MVKCNSFSNNKAHFYNIQVLGPSFQPKSQTEFQLEYCVDFLVVEWFEIKKIKLWLLPRQVAHSCGENKAQCKTVTENWDSKTASVGTILAYLETTA